VATVDEVREALEGAVPRFDDRTGDWAAVLDRASRDRTGRWPYAMMFRSRRRRNLVVFAAVVVVIALGSASALAVRAYVFHQGIIGLAPEDATPSSPEHGELVVGFGFGHTMSDAGRFDLNLYTDGRVIWQRLGDISRGDEYRDSTGLLEQRLTPAGVELVRDEVLSTGLNDLTLHGNEAAGLYFGFIDVRAAKRHVRVVWGDDITLLDVGPDVARQMPTPKQARALVRLDERLENLVNWLPASAWENPVERAYVPAGYSVCLAGKRGLGLARVLALLPTKAEDLLRTQENTPDHYTNLIGTFVQWCSHLTNDEARALQRVLDDAGVPGDKDVFGLAYGVLDIAYADATDFSLGFNPLLPDRG
jgi:hypothetical protein